MVALQDVFRFTARPTRARGLLSSLPSGFSARWLWYISLSYPPPFIVGTLGHNVTCGDFYFYPTGKLGPSLHGVFQNFAFAPSLTTSWETDRRRSRAGRFLYLPSTLQGYRMPSKKTGKSSHDTHVMMAKHRYVIPEGCLSGRML